MKTFQKITSMLSSFLMLIALMSFCKPGSETKNNSGSNVIREVQQKPSSNKAKPVKSTYKVTFIELGSVRCIPCQKMKLVMKAIEKKYVGQVNVVFHDVWTDAGKPYGNQYGITAIPTQVFLDESGKEFFRHEGYFPEEELAKVLNQKGVH